MPNSTVIRAKANSNYTCQECGATEFIQAHHEIRGDDNSLVVLCANCHSRRHPELPKGIFFARQLQPYWYNKSASTIAKQLNVHSRTIIRAAVRLGIKRGVLTPFDEELIKNNIPKLKIKQAKPRRVKEVVVEEKQVEGNLIAYEVPYSLRRAVPKKKSLEVTFPWVVAEKEAKILGLTVDQFIKKYKVVAQYNGFRGVHYIFKKINDGK